MNCQRPPSDKSWPRQDADQGSPDLSREATAQPSGATTPDACALSKQKKMSLIKLKGNQQQWPAFLSSVDINVFLFQISKCIFPIVFLMVSNSRMSGFVKNACCH